MKKRVDEWLVERGLIESRSKAQAMIIAGEVYMRPQKSTSEDAWQPVQKASQSFHEDVEFQIRSKVAADVGRGALKMRGALEAWKEIQVAGSYCLDVGASTGGFTQVLLEHGAQKVVALDVGTHQLHEKLRRDPRVVSIEQQHVLKIDETFWREKSLSPIFDIIVTDLSFISLERVIPFVAPWLKESGHWILLVKPQFELDRSKLVKGIVKKAEYQQEAVEKVARTAKAPELRLQWQALIDSPIFGGDGNKEFLLWLKKSAAHDKIGN
jgi:23S rRNA (cytidine1920-2'-O)/16S rRNA (cytidine1409-2'-O)-methyltransferase